MIQILIPSGFVACLATARKRLSGEKGNTLVSQKRMQRYGKFFIYANISQKKHAFFAKIAELCKIKISNEGEL